MVPNRTSPACGPLARARNIVEQPPQLQSGEIARQRKSGLGPQAVVAAIAGIFGDDRIDPGVLPDQSVVKRLAGSPVPDQRRLALIGDADGGEIRGARPCFSKPRR